MQEEEKSQEIPVDLQKEAKKIVMDKLEETGVIAKMKAQIKANVLSILEKQKEGMKQQIDFDYMTPLFRQNKPKEVVLICQLIKEFMKFYEMEYTIPIFENESNIKETVQRETLLKEFNMQDDKTEPKPVLLQLLLDYQKNKKLVEKMDTQDTIRPRGFGNFASRTDDNLPTRTSAYDIGNINTVLPKTQLPPLSFNKSVEMNATNDVVDSSAKFNSLDISDVYKREPKKDVTANDILNKNNNNTYDPVLGVNPEKKEIDDLIIGNYQTNNPKEDEDEFKEEILEDSGKLNENEESKKSFGNSDSNVNSLPFDSSVKDTTNKQFDYIEEAEKPK